MGQVFPLRSPVDLEEREPRLVDLGDDAADEVLDALSAATTRRMLAALHEEPRTASDLADLTGTSVQNAQYHLEKLQDADLIEAVDTWYSERGTEMTVYAPADGGLVLVAGEERDGSLRRLLSRALGAVGLLAGTSLAVWAVVDRVGRGTLQPRSAGGGGGGDSADIAAEAAGAADTAAAAAGLDPAVLAGLACFVGGLVALLAVALYGRHRRSAAGA